VVLEVEDEGSSARRTFFRGILRKKGEKVLPWVPAEERCLSRMPASSRGRTFFRRLHVLLAEEPAEPSSTATSPSPRRTFGTFFHRLHLLLAEEPSEPSSAGYLSFSRKNLRNFFRGPCFVVYWFFFLKIIYEPPIY